MTTNHPLKSKTLLPSTRTSNNMQSLCKTLALSLQAHNSYLRSRRELVVRQPLEGHMEAPISTKSKILSCSRSSCRKKQDRSKGQLQTHKITSLLSLNLLKTLSSQMLLVELNKSKDRQESM